MAHAEEAGVGRITASSAGTRAVIGHSIHEYAAIVLESLGGESGNFAARQFTPKLAADADLILTMTRKHRDTVLESVPRKLRQTFTLAEASRLCSFPDVNSIADLAPLRPNVDGELLADIADPIGAELETFEAVGSQISELLVPLFTFLERAST